MEQDNQSHRQRRENFLGVMLAMFSGAGILLFLILVSGGFFFYVLVAVMIIAVVGYFHYLLWGRALTQDVAGEREEEEARERWENDNESFREAQPPRRY